MILNDDITSSKSLQKTVKRCLTTSNIGLNFVPLDLNSLTLALFTDSFFAKAKNLKSQLGLVLALVDNEGKANIIHYGSSRCKRISRSVMKAEIFALIYGFDNALISYDILDEVLASEWK